MGSWADLHRDVLEVIAEKITGHIDFLRFAAVCKPWRSFVIYNLRRLPHNLPLCYCLPRQNPLPLLLRCNDDAAGMLDFFSTGDQKYASRFFLQEIRQKWIAGSFNGWLFTVEMDGREIQLLNPFTRAQIHLPSLSTFHHPEGYSMEDEDFNFVEKAVISSDPNKRGSDDDCVVIAIVSNMSVLSFCRPGDEKWTNVEGCTVYLSDVIPYKGEFYAISEMGVVIACDVAGDGKVKLIANRAFKPRKRYLVESASGDLLHVARIKDEKTESFTTHFDVYKLEIVDASKITETWHLDVRYQTRDRRFMHQKVLRFEWVKLESLGDQALFLGHNSSLCLPAQSVPGCKRDCIYFTNDDDVYVAPAGEYDLVLSRDNVGVYDMADGSIDLFGEVKDNSCATIWVTPNPW